MHAAFTKMTIELGQLLTQGLTGLNKGNVLHVNLGSSHTFVRASGIGHRLQNGHTGIRHPIADCEFIIQAPICNGMAREPSLELIKNAFVFRMNLSILVGILKARKFLHGTFLFVGRHVQDCR